MIHATQSDIWNGRIDDETNRAAFRLHQVIQQLPLKESATSPTCALIGFSSDEGVRRNNGRTGAAAGPDSLRSELAKLPWRQPESHQLIDLGTIVCIDDQLEQAQRELGQTVQEILARHMKPIILGAVMKPLTVIIWACENLLDLRRKLVSLILMHILIYAVMRNSLLQGRCSSKC